MLRACLLWLLLTLGNMPVAQAAQQQYEPMADSVRLALRNVIDDTRPINPIFQNTDQRLDWLAQMSKRLAKRIPSFGERIQLIKTIRYEAQRAGLDPQLVFALIEVESNFRSDAISSAGARGLMQVMPFWTDLLSNGDARQLFEPRVNIRYGCLILRHYLDKENGNLDRALARYNGSLGSMTYPNLVYDRLDRNWRYRYVPRH